MKAEAFRDDLAASLGTSLVGFDTGSFAAALDGKATTAWNASTSFPAPNLGTVAAPFYAPAWAGKSASELLGEIRDLKAALVQQHDERRATISLGGRCHGKSWIAGNWLALKTRHFETMWVDESAEIPLPAWLKLGDDERVTTAEKRAAATNFVRIGDMPGIAAMAAKAVQPLPDPVVSVLGQQVAQSELAEALALIRQKNAPAAEKETPRGLLCVRAFDHRLGAWGF